MAERQTARTVAGAVQPPGVAARTSGSAAGEPNGTKGDGASPGSAASGRRQPAGQQDSLAYIAGPSSAAGTTPGRCARRSCLAHGPKPNKSTHNQIPMNPELPDGQAEPAPVPAASEPPLSAKSNPAPVCPRPPCSRRQPSPMTPNRKSPPSPRCSPGTGWRDTDAGQVVPHLGGRLLEARKCLLLRGAPRPHQAWSAPGLAAPYTELAGRERPLGVTQTSGLPCRRLPVCMPSDESPRRKRNRNA